jgi:hypothetical protein
MLRTRGSALAAIFTGFHEQTKSLFGYNVCQCIQMPGELSWRAHPRTGAHA